MSQELVIETKDLTKVYDGTSVVDHLTLRVAKNEIFGLLGPNGAGKTTTILMLMGMTEPSSGTVHVAGFNPVREPLKVKRIVGYMPEKVGFYENLTPRENLKFIARLNNISEAASDKRIEELLKSVGLADSADLKVSKFSRGMKQRLGIADTLIKKPELVILDEPTAGLDPEGINHVVKLIASLPQAGTTVVMCSHRLHEVQKICNSIGIMSKGKMIVQGPLDQVGKKSLAEGRYRIEVETAEPTPELIASIKKLKAVRNVEAKGNMLIVSTDTDIRAELSKTIVQLDFPLIQMKIQEFNLDDIYMRYFHEESK